MKSLLSFRKAAGFTLIEMMCAVALTGVISSIAYPTYQNVVYKARRLDAQVALMQLQMAEERYRSDHSSYGSLVELGLAARTPSGQYELTVASVSETGFRVQAVASGVQASDTTCHHMQIFVDGWNVSYLSGPDAGLSNTAAANKQCWRI
ncbi:MAG: prepilin-type N-terminal cleavage/methylation domain-containing protein [Burkholderiales bacterium]|jgi:type IV pilus assembly protein PilE|nr:prepilin-type N-terminal cleavage/methylation domain-containing protein [Burkholderiales bacterium]